MAKRTIVQLIDDLDGGEADESLTFGLDGAEYELDLTVGHAKDLRELLAPYVLAGRRLRGGPARASHGYLPASRHVGLAAETGLSPKVVREWAVEQGYEISLRGRVSAEIVAAYKAAH